MCGDDPKLNKPSGVCSSGTVMSLLPVAFLLLVASVAFYIFIRRGRHGGLAGGSGASVPPYTPAAGQVSGRVFTEEEVAAHNTPDDLWLIIRGKVYNFTEYLPLHPGGEAILRNAGKDSTTGFSGSHHPLRVWDMVSTVLSCPCFATLR